MNKRSRADTTSKNVKPETEKPKFVEPCPRQPHRAVLVIGGVAVTIWLIVLAVIALRAV